jgi:cytochrome c-type biogenesis protein CcmH
MRRLLTLALLMSLMTPLAHAVQPDEVLSDPALEQRARNLSKVLRCMVCQNQSIDDSDAPLARDLRLLVRERIKLGDTDRQVLDFLVERYGEFVLLRPRLSWHTSLLWFGPPVLLVGGALALVLIARRRRTAGPAVQEGGALTPAEKARLSALIKQETASRRAPTR